jgi:hypothetical protein
MALLQHFGWNMMMTLMLRARATNLENGASAQQLLAVTLFSMHLPLDPEVAIALLTPLHRASLELQDHVSRKPVLQMDSHQTAVASQQHR